MIAVRREDYRRCTDEPAGQVFTGISHLRLLSDGSRAKSALSSILCLQLGSLGEVWPKTAVMVAIAIHFEATTSVFGHRWPVTADPLACVLVRMPLMQALPCRAVHAGH